MDSSQYYIQNRVSIFQNQFHIEPIAVAELNTD